MATLSVEGLDHQQLVSHLWNNHHIVVVRIDIGDVQGIRISPNVYTSIAEIDRFCDVVEGVLANGLPT
jgi:selenocysteine lyase/cysteine desulfurase